MEASREAKDVEAKEEEELMEKREDRKRRKADRKSKRYEELLQSRRQRRGSERAKRKSILRSQRLASQLGVSKREAKKQLETRLEQAAISGQKLCIDMSYLERMSQKEKGNLIGQLNRVWAAQKCAKNPASLYLAGMKWDSEFFKECCRRNDGFENYKWHIREESVDALFPPEKIVYLSPTATTPLINIDPEKVYVIGGLVDETRQKGASCNRAEEMKVETVRLPIAEHMTRSEKGSGNQTLAINQVVEIMLHVLGGLSWSAALVQALPKRFGYETKSDT